MLVALMMGKNASIWWENLKRQREKDGKKKIETWERMKKEMKWKYFSFKYYRQGIDLKIKNLSNKICKLDYQRRLARGRVNMHRPLYYWFEI